MGAARDASYQVYKAANNLALGPTMFNRCAPTTSTSCPTAGACARCSCRPSSRSPRTPRSSCWPLAALALCRVGRQRLGRLQRGLPRREVPGDRRPVEPAVRDRRRRHEPPDAPSGRVERAWKGSGGGISINWPRPGYQRGGRTPNVPGAFCASGTAQCRVTPDVAMDAAPQTGYIICSHGLGGFGATSGDRRRNQRCRAADGRDHGRRERVRRRHLGFANPFLYQTLVPAISSTSRRATTSTSPARLPGRPGLRHGDRARLGERRSVRGGAGRIHARRATFDTTKLTATHPTNMKRVKKGAVVTFSGVLTDATGAHPLANRQIIVVGNGSIIGFDRTGTSGGWQILFKVKKRHLARDLHGLGAREGPTLADAHRPHQALTPARGGASPTATLWPPPPRGPCGPCGASMTP